MVFCAAAVVMRSVQPKREREREREAGAWTWSQDYIFNFHLNFFVVDKIHWLEPFPLIGRYRIQQGSFDDFTIDNQTGSISIARKLDYDKRENYRIEVVAADMGKPIEIPPFSFPPPAPSIQDNGKWQLITIQFVFASELHT